MVEKNSYIVGKHRTEEGHTLFLGKVTAVQGSILSGYIEKNCHLPKLRQLFELSTKDVAVNLGPKPYPGQVLKFDTSHLYTGHRKVHDFFGDLHFFYVPDKKVGQTLMAAFDEAARLLKKAKLPQPENTVWEINPKEMRGKWAGQYAHSKKPGRQPHRLSIKPEMMPVVTREFVYVIMHEYGHYLHANHLKNPKLNAAWIRLFNTSIKPQNIDKEMSRGLLESLLAGEERPTDFRGQLEEQDRNAFNWIVRTINQDHAVNLKELDTLFIADDRDSIKALWPKRTLSKKELAPIVTPYATVNYHELFAESFAYYFLKKLPDGTRLPQGIINLMDKTFRRVEALEEIEGEAE